MVYTDLDATDSGLSFTTTMRMVIRVHNRTTNCRSDSHVTFTSSFTDVDQVVITVSDITRLLHGR